MLTFRVWLSLGFLAISGGLALVMPLAWATLFGLRTTDPLALAFARVAGAREIVLAAIAIVLVKRGVLGVATVSIGLATFIGVADFAVVFALRGAEAALNLAIHASGMVLLGTTWLSLRNSPRERCDDAGLIRPTRNRADRSCYRTESQTEWKPEAREFSI